MARIEGNDLTLGLRGKFGKQFVFRKYKSRTIATRKGETVDRRTADQLEHRERFRLAAMYAKRALKNPELKAAYEAIAEATESNTFAAAVTDYLKSIIIIGVMAEEYDGQIGFPLTFNVDDPYKVKTMKITLTDAGSTLIESGNASLTGQSIHYSYVTTKAIPDISGLKVKIEVTDRPGKVVIKEVTLQ
jgi:hypothetical protein